MKIAPALVLLLNVFTIVVHGSRGGSQIWESLTKPVGDAMTPVLSVLSSLPLEMAKSGYGARILLMHGTIAINWVMVVVLFLFCVGILATEFRAAGRKIAQATIATIEMRGRSLYELSIFYLMFSAGGVYTLSMAWGYGGTGALYTSDFGILFLGVLFYCFLQAYVAFAVLLFVAVYRFLLDDARRQEPAAVDEK